LYQIFIFFSEAASDSLHLGVTSGTITLTAVNNLETERFHGAFGRPSNITLFVRTPRQFRYPLERRKSIVLHV